MRDNRKAGLALMVGSLGGMVTMAIHPVGNSTHFAVMAPVAHTLAMASVLVLFLGACGLARALAGPDRLAFAALVTYGFAAVAVMTATAMSGWVGPAMMRMMDRDVAEAAGMWRIVLASMFQINQAFSRIYSVAASGAITLWSVCCLRAGRLSRGVAVYGCVSAPLVALLLFVGHLRLDVHGMTVVMVSQVVWFVGMGWGLWRVGEAERATACSLRE